MTSITTKDIPCHAMLLSPQKVLGPLPYIFVLSRHQLRTAIVATSLYIIPSAFKFLSKEKRY